MSTSPSERLGLARVGARQRVCAQLTRLLLDHGEAMLGEGEVDGAVGARIDGEELVGEEGCRGRLWVHGQRLVCGTLGRVARKAAAGEHVQTQRAGCSRLQPLNTK